MRKWYIFQKHKPVHTVSYLRSFNNSHCFKVKCPTSLSGELHILQLLICKAYACLQSAPSPIPNRGLWRHHFLKLFIQHSPVAFQRMTVSFLWSRNFGSWEMPTSIHLHSHTFTLPSLLSQQEDSPLSEAVCFCCLFLFSLLLFFSANSFFTNSFPFQNSSLTQCQPLSAALTLSGRKLSVFLTTFHCLFRYL